MSGCVILTGASGFLGRNLAPYLEGMGYQVVPISLRDPGWRNRMPQGPTAVIHLAGLAHDLKGAARLEEFLRINAGLAEEAFDASREAGATRFVFISSVKAVSDRPGPDFLAEEAVPAPGTPYGLSKWEAEKRLRDADRGGGTRLYILRPCMIHGPGNRGNLNLLYRWVAAGIPCPLARFANSRSFLSIDNFNFILGELCVRDIPPGTYHLADSECLSTVEVVRLIGAALGVKPRLWGVPAGLIRAVAGMGTALDLPFGEETLRKLTEDYRVSNRKILSALGRSLPVTAREGMLRSLASFSADRR